jgi:hypothetical protein
MDKQVMIDVRGRTIGIGDRFKYNAGDNAVLGEVIETVGGVATIVWEDQTLPIHVEDFYDPETDTKRLYKL